MRILLNLMKSSCALSTILRPRISGKSCLCNSSPAFINSSYAVKLYSSDKKKKPDKNDEKEFLPIYNLSTVRMLAMLGKQKILMGAITCLGFPICHVLELNGALSSEMALGFLGIGLSFTTVLTIVSAFLTNTIGIIYVSTDTSTIKLSTINFMGNRKEVFLPSDDWVMLSDLSPSYLSKYYLNTKTYSKPDSWKLFVYGANVIDRECFEKIIGIM